MLKDSTIKAIGDSIVSGSSVTEAIEANKVAVLEDCEVYHRRTGAAGVVGASGVFNWATVIQLVITILTDIAPFLKPTPAPAPPTS